MHAKGVSLNSPAHFGLATADVSIACRFPQFPCPAGWLAVTILNGKTHKFSLAVRPPQRLDCVCTRRGASMIASDKSNLANKEVT